MKASRVVVLIFAFASLASYAAETNLTLTVDGVTYSNVTFGTVSPAAVSIRHSTGISSVPLAKLPPELQKQFDYDPQKAEQHRQTEAQRRAAWQKAKQEAAADAQQKQIQNEQDKLLTGQDLVAWKLAKTAVIDYWRDSMCRLPEDTKPLKSSMRKTETGDYDFTFVLHFVRLGKPRVDGTMEMLGLGEVGVIGKVRVVDLGTELRVESVNGLPPAKTSNETTPPQSAN